MSSLGRAARSGLHLEINNSFDSKIDTIVQEDSLSPDLQPGTPPCLNEENETSCNPLIIGDYLIYEQTDVIYEQTDDQVGITFHKSYHTLSREEVVCKIVPMKRYREIVSAYWRVGNHENINEIIEILLGETKVYVFFKKHYGCLHSYVRNKRKLKESEASKLFHQIVSAVDTCHENGIVLRDLKLRKFVFKDKARTQLKLEGLEDACILKEDNDFLDDKHGCPAYVSPEILNTMDTYSGKAADAWSLGVMLYTMLIGRYPFHDKEPRVLFTKIRRLQYSIPDTVSSRAKCLIKSLLRKQPEERLLTNDLLLHPWFKSSPSPSRHKSDLKGLDHVVPNDSIDNCFNFYDS